MKPNNDPEVLQVFVFLALIAAFTILFSGCSDRALTLTSPSSVSVDNTACKINYTQPGSYTLDRDVTASYCAIGIYASDVKLNLNGHTLTGPSDVQAVSYGVVSDGNSGVEVYNGTINGFMYGASIRGQLGRGDDTKNNSAHDLVVSGSSFRGIVVDGYNTNASNNTVSDTGPTNVYPDNYSIGIEVRGPSCTVNNNTVTETYGGMTPGLIRGEGVAISFSHYSTYCVADGNTISNSRSVSNQSTFGFWVDVYSQVTLTNNYIRNMHYSAVVPPFTIQSNNDIDISFIHVITDR